jgi:hypothetical protein
LPRAGTDRVPQSGVDRFQIDLVRLTGVAKIVERRDRTADAQHVKTDKNRNRFRPEGEELFDRLFRTHGAGFHDIAMLILGSVFHEEAAKPLP